MPKSATVAKLELAHRMREYRAAAGESARAISARMAFSPNYLSALENGREVLSKDKLGDLIDVYDLGHSEGDQLAELIDTSKLVHWFERPPYDEGTSEELKVLCGLEMGATSASVYESVLVTGLVQTPAYAEALISSDALNSRASIKHKLALRLKRQERLRGTEPLSLTVVMSEAALMQQIGGREVLRGQLQHLADLIDELSTSLAVHIQPFEASELALVSASTVVSFGFGEEMRLDPVVWRESIIPVEISDDDDLVELLSINLASAVSRSLSREESQSLIRARIAQLS